MYWCGVLSTHSNICSDVQSFIFPCGWLLINLLVFFLGLHYSWDYSWTRIFISEVVSYGDYIITQLYQSHYSKRVCLTASLLSKLYFEPVVKLFVTWALHLMSCKSCWDHKLLSCFTRIECRSKLQKFSRTNTSPLKPKVSNKKCL